MAFHFCLSHKPDFPAEQEFEFLFQGGVFRINCTENQTTIIFAHRE